MVAGAWTLSALAELDLGPNLVANPGFEERGADGRAVGWHGDPRYWTCEDGVGRDGSRAFVYRNDKPNAYSVPSSPVNLRAGSRYLVEAWVKTALVPDVGENHKAAVCAEWYDDKKWLGGAYSSGIGGTNGWMKVSTLTEAMPTNAVRFNVSPLVGRGRLGTVWFDDVSVREVHEPPVAQVTTDVYRNTAWEGDVEFAAVLVSREFSDGLDGARAVFRFNGADGHPFEVAARLDGECAVASVAVERLAMGRQTVHFEIAAGKTTAHKDCAFTRTAGVPNWKVRFDRHRRTIVDGKPFFPLGMYFSSVGTNDVELFSKSPFNCLMAYNSPTKAQLDLCAEKGLKVIYSVKDCFAGHSARYRDESDETAWIRARAAFVTNHPATLAWYTNDELGPEWWPRLTARRDFLEALDPDHPCWSVIWQYTQMRRYMPTFDVIGTDPYPSAGKDLERPIKWMRAGEAGMRGKRPVWQVPLASDLAAYQRDRAKAREMPEHTKDEYRNMIWQALAGGANGLVLYSWFDIRRMDWKRPWAQAFADVCELAQEVKDQTDVFLSTEAPVRWSVPAGTPETLAFRTWRLKGATYLLALNAGKTRTTVAVALGERYASLETLVGPKDLATLARPDSVRLDLPHAAVVFVKLR